MPKLSPRSTTGFIVEHPINEYSKPLFVPLKTEFFAQFKSGSKTEELRKYGNRWNEFTCSVGRAVTLSKGYGKRERLAATIWRFKKQHGTTFGSTYQQSILKCFGTLDVWIAVISLRLEATNA